MTIQEITAEMRKTQNEMDATRPSQQVRLVRLGDKLWDLKAQYETTLRLAGLTAT